MLNHSGPIFMRDASIDLPSCGNINDYDGNINLRILSVFIILISSGLGACFPVLSSRYSFIKLPDWCFFFAKFFGSGVIVTTGFVHLLQPASESLSNPCLGGTFGEYPWAFGICLMSLFALFFLEIVIHYSVSNRKLSSFSDNVYESGGSDSISEPKIPSLVSDLESCNNTKNEICTTENQDILPNSKKFVSVPGASHFSHDLDHQDLSQLGTLTEEDDKEQYVNHVIAVFILEFGVIFHSIFIGLSLAVSGKEFITLFVVIIFHQMFEGLGLGTRVAEVNWPKAKRWTPWLLCLGYTISTPISIAIGIGVRSSFSPGSRKTLISSGIFDSISAGILIYTGLVELMAHEFLYSNQFKGPNNFVKMVSAYVVMCLGAGLMALLGKWA